ncbi:hypothetical protein I3842_06G036500 [Carya illinoinensis]|uniref:Uncharacterized protein n=1 Tax=Carya illinoinensis TaxID=32201 RepID=A0A922JG87_CARIL|nr:hypothetical protein I3842_06G036500 [Carya illinoinensis]
MEIFVNVLDFFLECRRVARNPLSMRLNCETHDQRTSFGRQVVRIKKLEWESFSIDLLPHPDVHGCQFSLLPRGRKGNQRVDDGAKRVLFGRRALYRRNIWTRFCSS